ncbi:InvB/SpaK family type III secretion system chaperone [Dyella sp. Tek66A03]|uniref:InvB/SpaK family type III secretion system chaperone n=1 Tax=Dyella sp. Tek66A03 TaxID=3458298 RepID=UPI00403EBE3C
MIDLKNNLCEALSILGCSPSQYDFDDKSAIAMSFNDIGDVFIDFDKENDQVWIWGCLPDMPSEALRSCAFSLLQEVSVPVEYLASGGLVLRANDDQVRRLGGLLRGDYVADPKHLAAAIEGFYLRMVQILELVK